MKNSYHHFALLLLSLTVMTSLQAQALHLPQNTNLHCQTGRRLNVTDIDITWNAPGVKGREGKIWGTPVAYYGYDVLGYGSEVKSPWRAGADESTVISFSTDVMINGKKLAAGKYGFFIALYPDSCVLIFNKNTEGWGSYFYRSDLDVLHVATVQQKNQPQLVERLTYNFYNQTEKSVEIALEWERWKIPFTVEVDAMNNTLEYIRTQMSGALGFDPPSLEQAALWCSNNNVNLDQALQWINAATDPQLGGSSTFRALSTKAAILQKQGKGAEADAIMEKALENGSVTEIHGYGRQLLGQKKNKEAFAVFEKNYKKYQGAWPTNAGMMRGYSALGDTKSALKHAKMAVEQAPDAQNKDFLQRCVEKLEQGKTID